MDVLCNWTVSPYPPTRWVRSSYTSGSTSYETIPPDRLESSGDVLSTVGMVVQRRDGHRRLRDHDDGDDVTGLSTLFAGQPSSVQFSSCGVNKRLQSLRQSASNNTKANHR